jgi:hypothetical protein
MIFAPSLTYAESKSNPFYRVKAHDSVSEVLLRFGIKPIYGKSGTLSRTLDLNPKTKAFRGNRIYPGELLYLPIAYDYEFRTASILASGEVVESEVKVQTHPFPVGETGTTSESHEELTTRSPTHERQVRHGLELGVHYAFTSLTSREISSGASATLNSSSAPGFHIAFHQEWTESLASSFRFDLEKIAFAPSNNPLKAIVTESVMKTRFTLGFEKAFHESFSATLLIGYGTEIFVRGMSTSQVVVDEKPMTSIGIQPRLILLRRGRTTFGLAGEATYIPASSGPDYEIKSGTRFGLESFIQYTKISGSVYRLHLGFQTRAQGTSLTNQTESEVLGGVSFRFNSFAEDGE